MKQKNNRFSPSDMALRNTQMIAKNEINFQKAIQLARLQAWAMSLLCGLLGLFAAAAATRIPFYLSVADYVRFIGVVSFGLLVLAGVVDNVRTHLCLRQLQTESRAL